MLAAAKLLLLSIAFVLLAAPFATCEEPTVFFVVRHAEKASPSGDPPLSEEGHQRAQDLMQTLKHLRINTIYHTPLVRSRQTAEPLAGELHLELTPYDGASEEWINEVRTFPAGRRVLIVAHADTVDKIVKGLTGKTVPQVGDHYDNLFIVSIDGDDKSVVHLKYGAEH